MLGLIHFLNRSLYVHLLIMSCSVMELYRAVKCGYVGQCNVYPSSLTCRVGFTYIFDPHRKGALCWRIVYSIEASISSSALCFPLYVNERKSLLHWLAFDWEYLALWYMSCLSFCSRKQTWNKVHPYYQRFYKIVGARVKLMQNFTLFW